MRCFGGQVGVDVCRVYVVKRARVKFKKIDASQVRGVDGSLGAGKRRLGLRVGFSPAFDLA